MTFSWNDRKLHINMITCMKMKSFVPYYASIIMFYHVNLACYQHARERGRVEREEERVDRKRYGERGIEQRTKKRRRGGE